MKTLPFKSLRPTTYKSLGMRPAKKLVVHSNPCHDEQGKFCSTGGSEGSFSTDLSNINKESFNHWEGMRGIEARDAFSLLKEGKPGFIVKKEGDIKGIVAWHFDKNHPFIEVAHLATIESGYGSMIMKEVSRRAAAQEKGVWLTSRDNARDFYRKLGMKEAEPRIFTFTKEQAKAFSDQKLKAYSKLPTLKELTDLEPEDGVFIVAAPTPITHALSTPGQKRTKLKPGAKPRLVKINGLLAHQTSSRVDPTRTTGLRNRWAAEMGRRFTALRRLIWKAIVDDDCFGLGPAYKMYRPAVHSNPCHDEQGRFCSTGSGDGKLNIPKEPYKLPGPTQGRFAGHDVTVNTEIREYKFEPKTVMNPSGSIIIDHTIYMAEIGSQGNGTVGSSYLRASYNSSKGYWTITQIGVDESMQRKGVAETMLKMAVAKVGEPVHTSGVFSEKGRALNEGLVRKGLADRIDNGNDYLIHMGWNKSPTTHTFSTPAIYVKFDFPRLEDKIPAFMQWLQQQQDEGILELITLPRMGQSLGEPWTNMFVKDSYERGVIRAREQLMSAGYGTPGMGDVGIGLPLLGTPELSGIMANPFHVDRLASMFLRSFDTLKGITSDMDKNISHVLAQGLADGDNPITLAKKMNYVISGMGKDLGVTDSLGRFIPAERRAKMLARTEVIRSHAVATLQEAKIWGVAGVTAEVEFVNVGFNVCPECISLQGKTYTIEEAMNIIPVHPHCRCAWIIKPIEGRYVEPLNYPD